MNKTDARKMEPYWKLFNGFVRVVAYGFVFVGALISLSNLYSAFTTRVDDIAMAAISVGFPLVVAVLGYLILKAKPYNGKKNENE